MFRLPAVLSHDSPFTPSGRAALDALITNQATMIGYMDDFKLMMLMSVAAMPLVFLLRPRPRNANPSEMGH